MKKFVFVLLILIFIFSACTNVETQVVPTVTAGPSPTKTLIPSHTPRPPTKLPPISTFTPTFDVSKIVTVTPAEKAECAETKEDVDIELLPNNEPKITSDNLGNRVVKALNAGMPIEEAFSILANQYELDKNIFDTQNLNVEFTLERQIFLFDLTNDGLPELIINYFNIYIITCQNGKYETVDSILWDGLGKFKLTPLTDINKNGINEILIIYRGCMWSRCGNATIKEWDGKKFQTLLNSELSEVGKIYFEDIDLNGIAEFIHKGGVPPEFIGDYIYNVPWRDETHIYKWNGQEFVPEPVIYSPPEYRFQVIQDADKAVLRQDYETAFQLYQSAISDPNLEWWSWDRRLNTISQLEAYSSNLATPTSIPEDTTQYPRLAAYAYFRLIALNTYLNEINEAQKNYNSVIETFFNNEHSKPYIEMTNRFWETYQLHGDIANACKSAINYAEGHLEMLEAISWYNYQSHYYVPEDICPFR